MKSYAIFRAIVRSTAILSLVFLMIILPSLIGVNQTNFDINDYFQIKTASAASIEELNQQKADALAQARAAEQAAQEQMTVAQKAAQRITQVSGQIQQVQSSIVATNGNISQTGKDIEQKNQDVAYLESELRRIKDQQDALIRQMYIMKQSAPDLLVYFSGESMSSREERQAQMTALKKSVTAIMVKTQESKLAVEDKRTQLQRKNTELESLKAQQDDQKRGLADYKYEQAALKDNAEAAVTANEVKRQKALQQAAIIDQKIKVLTATSNWGNQIVSSDDGSWYYSQTGNYTRLGPSPYTVSEYGCLITSYAMVSTYYGTKITPTYIAQNGSFDWGGYLYGLPAGMGFTKQPMRSIDWNVVNKELNAGHPVIVSIYLSTVGSINTDGSSHFIVIKGSSGGKYLMHDPIGDGRSYNLNQVRSMILTSPL